MGYLKRLYAGKSECHTSVRVTGRKAMMTMIIAGVCSNPAGKSSAGFENPTLAGHGIQFAML